jgi:DNA-3-methyladenine glycosylase I
MRRCAWATHESLQAYHDHEWGVPVHDDRLLFEMLTLEGAQAGLSWTTILRKREGYRHLFADFAIHQIAVFRPADVDRLLADPAIVRHRGKIEATITNARAAQRVIELHGSVDSFL